MANKKITDLELRANFSETCNIPVDDSVSTKRVTGQQVLQFLQSYGLINTYDAAVEYSEDDLVMYQGQIYRSLEDTNQGNTPSSSAEWQASLYVPGANKGLTPGASIATGDVGEVVRATMSTGNQTMPTSIASDVTGSSITLSPGVWQFYMSISGELVGGVGDGGCSIFLSDSSNNIIDNTILNRAISNGAYVYGRIFDLVTPPQSVTTSTTYKLRCLRTSTNGSATIFHDGANYGTSKFWAQRIV